MNIKRELKDLLLVLLGILSAGMGLKGFLLSSKFIDGGVTGISMLLADITGAPISVLIFILNVPFIIIGYKRLGVSFACLCNADSTGRRQRQKTSPKEAVSKVNLTKKDKILFGAVW